MIFSSFNKLFVKLFLKTFLKKSFYNIKLTKMINKLFIKKGIKGFIYLTELMHFFKKVGKFYKNLQKNN